MSALLKNIQAKKISIEELNENILNSLDPEEIEREIQEANDLELLVEMDVGIMTEFLEKLVLDNNAVVAQRVSETEVPSRESSPESTRSISQRSERFVDNQSVRSVRSSSSQSSIDPAASQARNDRVSRPSVQVRLPKFEMKKFGGDPITWPEFSETFLSTRIRICQMWRDLLI